MPNGNRGGSTIGPVLASLTGIKTIDIGIPIQSMHSCREMSGTLDLLDLKNMSGKFYETYGDIKQVLFDE